MIEEIKKKLEEHISIHHLEISDDSAHHLGHKQNVSGGGHYIALIVSDSFDGISLVERHRLVYKALGGLIGREIHAFSMKTLTREEYDRTNDHSLKS